MLPTTTAAPPITMTLNSTASSSSPTTSFKTLLSGTGFFLWRIRILSTGMLVCDETSSFNVKIEVEGGCEDSFMSKGGLRRDFKDTEMLRSWPGANFRRFGSDFGIFGRIYFIRILATAPRRIWRGTTYSAPRWISPWILDMVRRNLRWAGVESGNK